HTRSNGDRRAPGLSEIVGVVGPIAPPSDEPMANGDQAVRVNRGIVNPNWLILYGGAPLDPVERLDRSVIYGAKPTDCNHPAPVVHSGRQLRTNLRSHASRVGYIPIWQHDIRRAAAIGRHVTSAQERLKVRIGLLRFIARIERELGSERRR